MYLNQEYVFPAAPPLVPADYNPVGSYLRVVELPEAWFAEKLEVCPSPASHGRRPSWNAGGNCAEQKATVSGRRN